MNAALAEVAACVCRHAQFQVEPVTVAVACVYKSFLTVPKCEMPVWERLIDAAEALASLAQQILMLRGW